MPNDLDLICFSHLRWGQVLQRTNQLMSRCSRERRVFFFEEPRFEEWASSKLSIEQISETLHVVTPVLAPGEDLTIGQREALSQLYRDFQLYYPMHWFYTPMAMDFARAASRSLSVYDCMDENCTFRDAPGALPERERELFSNADLVFAGGRSVFEAKRGQHSNVHLFPSSVDVDVGDEDADPDAFVTSSAWDDTWQRMWTLMMQTMTTKASARAPSDGKVRSRGSA